MSVPSSAYSILLFTTDAAIQAQVGQVFMNSSITAPRDAAALQREVQRHQFDVVIIESRSGHDLPNVFTDHLDTAYTLFVHGSRSALRKTLKMIQSTFSPSAPPQTKVRDGSLENYLEAKMGEFVKGMRNGSARNLHPILISAVERPLITSALRETRGNQIQAAELLGLNRNTLRKKIADLHIPVKQTKAKASRGA